MSQDKIDESESDTKLSADEMSEKEVDANLAGSFPASDPPSWTLGTNHRTTTKEDTGEPEDERHEE